VGPTNKKGENMTTEAKRADFSNNWLEQEEATFPEMPSELTPSLKLQTEGQPYTIIIDFSQPFDKRPDKFHEGLTKAKIPCTYEGQQRIFWLNIKNPIYKDIIRAGRAGQTVFNIVRTGSEAKTRYILLRDK
jgi:hypothetical protein